ncbi:hypothetical protein KBZ21_39320, partial [Streptomyces sp. A73]|nr:hypothetical protein [Streptomyces sp. A73]
EFCHPYWPASDPDAERRGESVARYGGDDPMPAIRVQWQHKSRKDPANLDARGVPVFAPPKYGSERTLVIPPFLAELLERHLES